MKRSKAYNDCQTDGNTWLTVMVNTVLIYNIIMFVPFSISKYDYDMKPGIP